MRVIKDQVELIVAVLLQAWVLAEGIGDVIGFAFIEGCSFVVVVGGGLCYVCGKQKNDSSRVEPLFSRKESACRRSRRTTSLLLCSSSQASDSAYFGQSRAFLRAHVASAPSAVSKVCSRGLARIMPNNEGEINRTLATTTTTTIITTTVVMSAESAAIYLRSNSAK